VYTSTVYQQLEIPSARSWAAPVRATEKVRYKKAGGTARQSHTKSYRYIGRAGTQLPPSRVLRVCYQPDQASWRVGSYVYV
jgi:hypothetical protein